MVVNLNVYYIRYLYNNIIFPKEESIRTIKCDPIESMLI